MANKNKLIRLKVLDQCLRNRYKSYSLEALVDACSEALYEYEGVDKGISKRSVQEDIKDMRSGKFGYEAPIVCENGVYQYSDPAFSIFNSPLLADDIEAIRSTIGILNQFSELGQTDALRQIETKLRNLLATYDEDDRTLVQFEKSTYPAAEHWLKILYGYVKRKTGLAVTYQPFTYDTPATFRAFPLLLKEYNDRWFLIGHNPDGNFVQNFALDRLICVVEDYTVEEPILSFDPVLYYQHLIGVSKAEAGTEEITFRATPVLRHYLETKPLHSSQQLIDPAKSLFMVKLGVNFELKAKLLSYGPALVVVTPYHLRDDIANQHRLAAEQYKHTI
jgi:predicted DNA-binding transcriptional regulator YafY